MPDNSLEVLKKNLENLKASTKWFKRSFDICMKHGVKDKYSESEFDDFENLTSRFARTVDLLINKVLRSIDLVEFMEPGSVIDAANRAEKRGLIDSVNNLRKLKDLRNEITHEYETEDLKELFFEVISESNLLLALSERVQEYCRIHFP